MLSKIRFQHYKSLYDTEVELEPLIVFIGPNGSGKSNICEALAVWSDFINNLMKSVDNNVMELLLQSIKSVSKNSLNIESKFWQRKLNYLLFEAFEIEQYSTVRDDFVQLKDSLKLIIKLDYYKQDIELKTRYKGKNISLTRDPILNETYKDLFLNIHYHNSTLCKSLEVVQIYDFAPYNLSNKSQNIPMIAMDRTGQGIAYSLVDILLTNRLSFDELEERLTQLVPNIARISLPRKDQTFELELIDKYSDHHIPTSDISDGTLRILAFLVALYQEKTPSIICFEEIENGIHPWLLHKMMELLKIVSTEGINGKPVQILITTHSPLVLNYVEPNQVRAVELDNEGKTQVHALPTDSVRFQKALEAYDGELGELWFTNVFGGNPV
ncbi:MAG: AAA family ATPase [Xenococcus sp. (in: cyanobacteria)]